MYSMPVTARHPDAVPRCRVFIHAARTVGSAEVNRNIRRPDGAQRQIGAETASGEHNSAGGKRLCFSVGSLHNESRNPARGIERDALSACAVANLNPKRPGAGKKPLRISEPASRTRGFVRPGEYTGISFIKLRVELHSDRLEPGDDAGTLLHHAFDEFGISDSAPTFKRIAEELLGRVRSPHALLTFRVEGIKHPGTHEHVAARQRHFFNVFQLLFHVAYSLSNIVSRWGSA